MKKLIFFMLIALVFSACEKNEVMENDLKLKKAVADDGIKLVGEHFNLNIIGVKEKVMDSIAAGGVIFVNLYGTSEIHLIEGDDYAVLDKNGTDEDGALFQLPDPGLEAYSPELLDLYADLDFDTETDYSVYVRPLGTLKDDPSAVLTTLAEIDTDFAFGLTGDGSKLFKAILRTYGDVTLVWGDLEPNPVTLERKKKAEWANVTAELLTVVYQLEVWGDDDGEPLTPDVLLATLYVRIPIFNEMLEEGSELWEYANDGLKLLQVRFYPWGTDVTYDDGFWE